LLVFFYEDTPAQTQKIPTQDTLRRNCTGAHRLYSQSITEDAPCIVFWDDGRVVSWSWRYHSL